MDEINSELLIAVTELRKDIQYIKVSQDEMKQDIKELKEHQSTQCINCDVAKKLEKHLQDHKDNRYEAGGWIKWVVTTALALGALGISLFKR